MLISILVTFQFVQFSQFFNGDSDDCFGEDMYGCYSSDVSCISLHGFTDDPCNMLDICETVESKKVCHGDDRLWKPDDTFRVAVIFPISNFMPMQSQVLNL